VSVQPQTSISGRRLYPASIHATFAGLWQHFDLVWQLTAREVLTRYQGSIFGVAWSLFYPVLMLTVYTFVFSVAFKARWGGTEEESNIAFAIILFVGLFIHGFFAECIVRAPSLILSNATYVKKIVFPLDILPWVGLGAALFHAMINVVVLLAAQLLLNHTLPWTAIFLPFVLIPLIFGILGLSWLLSSIGVYVRDIGQTVGVATTVLMFLSPVFYPVSALPEPYRVFLQLNPLTFIIEQARAVLIWGHAPDWITLLLYSFGGFMLAWLGFWWFQRTRAGFADVI